MSEALEVTKGKERVPRDETEVIDSLKMEFKRLKIENHREKLENNPNDGDKVYFGDNRSRWDDWKKFKNTPRFDQYKRSTSQPGMWRSQSGNYRRAPSRTPSRKPFQRDRSHSRGNPGGERSASKGKHEERKGPSLMERVSKLEENQSKEVILLFSCSWKMNGQRMKLSFS